MEFPQGYNLLQKPRAKKASSEDGKDILITSDNYHIFWTSSFHTGFDKRRIGRHFATGYGESIHVKRRLKFINTNSGNCKVSIFEQELDYLKNGAWHSNTWEGKFTCALTLTTIVIRDAEIYGWFSDNEFPRDIERTLAHTGG